MMIQLSRTRYTMPLFRAGLEVLSQSLPQKGWKPFAVVERGLSAPSWAP